MSLLVIFTSVLCYVKRRDIHRNIHKNDKDQTQYIPFQIWEHFEKGLECLSSSSVLRTVVPLCHLFYDTYGSGRLQFHYLRLTQIFPYGWGKYYTFPAKVYEFLFSLTWAIVKFSVHYFCFFISYFSLDMDVKPLLTSLIVWFLVTCTNAMK